MIFGPNGETISKNGDSYYTKDGYVHKSGSMYRNQAICSLQTKEVSIFLGI